MKSKQSLTAITRQIWLDSALEELTEGRSPAEVFAGMLDDLDGHKRDLAKGEKESAEFITDRRTLTAILSEATKLHAEKAKDNWRTHFESAGEIEAGPPVWLIENWLMKGATMALSGLPESYKTFVALNLCRALLTGGPLFGKLAVGEKADILYLIPEMSRSMFFARQKIMRAGNFQDRFLSQTLDRPRLELSNPITLAAASGRVVVIDTAPLSDRANGARCRQLLCSVLWSAGQWGEGSSHPVPFCQAGTVHKRRHVTEQHFGLRGARCSGRNGLCLEGRGQGKGRHPGDQHEEQPPSGRTRRPVLSQSTARLDGAR